MRGTHYQFQIVGGKKEELKDDQEISEVKTISAMANLFLNYPVSKLCCPKSASKNCLLPLVNRTRRFRNAPTKAFFFNPTEQPIIKEALKEPVAFMGGLFAGILRLDMNDDPLKEWVTRTVEVAGITEDEIGDNGSSTAEDDTPQQMEIE